MKCLGYCLYLWGAGPSLLLPHCLDRGTARCFVPGRNGKVLDLEFWSLSVHGVGGMLVDRGLEEAEHLGLNTALFLVGSLL